ncbi:hypothetical protein QBC35DRAFT_486280 [Podospora australis]|uniref:CFEM domain-containing protein n=1 Tax=Podospora australis TaxID=1536484 RepID=A0AAN7AKC3_9PEZI|nr:hypothetical protein QBC35DRAFT_486280 [Podospora australis]
MKPLLRFLATLLVVGLPLLPVVSGDQADEVGKLFICGQTCVTAQFSICQCSLGDFPCLCGCNNLTPTLQQCAGIRCSANMNETIQGFVETICPRASTTSSSSVSSQTSTTSIITSTTPPARSNSTVPSATCKLTNGTGTAIWCPSSTIVISEAASEIQGWAWLLWGTWFFGMAGLAIVM